MRRILSLALLAAAALSVSTIVTTSAASKPPPKSKKAPKSAAFQVPRGWPKQLSISTIGIRAPVEALALTKKSDTDAPYKWGDVAWFDRGARPGDMGRAVMYGHLDSACCPAVFYRLRSVKAGTIIEVNYKTGAPLKFKVMWNATYADNKLPLKWLYAMAKERGMSLITCAGVFHKNAVGYDHRQVVYARVLLPNGKLG